MSGVCKHCKGTGYREGYSKVTGRRLPCQYCENTGYTIRVKAGKMKEQAQ